MCAQSFSSARVSSSPTGGGALIHKEEKTAKFSMNAHCRVPENAVDAVLAIDCFCAGTHDLVVPYFADNPPPKKAKDR